MTMRSVGFQLRADGKTEVKNDFREVQKAANDSMDAVATAAEQAADRAGKATEAATKRQEDAWKRQAQAAKLAAGRGVANSAFDDAAAQAGNGSQFATVNLDRSTGAARESASVFQEAFAAQEAGERAAAEAAKVAAEADAAAARAAEERAGTVAKLRAALDPLGAAQARYAADVARVEELEAAGDITATERAAAVRLYGEQLNTTRVRLDEGAAAQERLAARVRAFVATIDPAAAAQQRFDTEIAEARSLISQGAISLDQYCAKLRQSQSALDDTGEAHTRMGASGAILQHVVRSTADSFSAGLPPMMIFTEQLGRLGEAAAMSGAEGGALGTMAKFMSGGWGLAVTAAISIGATLASTLLEGADAAKTMEEHQRSLGSVLDQTTGKINEQSTALRLHAAILTQSDAAMAKSQADEARQSLLSLGRPTFNQGNPLGGVGQVKRQDSRITAALTDFDRSGNVDLLAKRMDAIGRSSPLLKGVTTDIINQGAAWVEADRRAQTYQARVRLLVGQGKPGDQRIAAGQFGPEKPDLALVDAQAKLAAATTKGERAEAQATITRIQAKKAFDDGSISIDEYRKRMTAADAAVNASHTHVDRHALSLGREAASMEVAARASLTLADAYLTGGAAAIEAEARRKAAADATRKGIDVEAQVRRQLDVQIGEGTASGAKAVAGLRDESDARDAVIAKVTAGTVSVYSMSRALADENALRPLLTLRMVAQGAQLETLNRVIAAYRAELDRAHKSETNFGLEKTLQDSADRVAELKSQIADLGHAPLTAALNAAVRSAAREADSQNLALDDPKRHDLRNARVDEAQAQYDMERQRYAHDTLVSQQDSLSLAQRELQLVGANDNLRASELDKLKMQLEIKRRFPDMAQADVDAMLAGVGALDKVNARLKLANAAMDEVRQAGDQFLQDLLNPDGSGLKNLLKDVESELIKLALLNPLKNMLLGESNPTIGSVFTAISSRIGGGIGHNASGTYNWSGGRTYMNENGGEIADLPNGTRIYPAAETRRMLAANDDQAGARSVLEVHLKSDLLDARIADGADGRVALAAPGIASGAASMASTQAARARRRQLGTR